MNKIILLFIFTNFLLYADCPVDIQKELHSIPNEEQVKLEHFFRTLIRQYGFGYTLFGDKPVSLLFWSAEPDYNKKRPYFSVNENFIESYSVWKKYEKVFPSNKYILQERIISIEKEYIDLVFINKSLFNEIIKRNSEFFSSQYDTNTFLKSEKLENYLNSSDEQKSKYHIRMGILLGYGKENSIEFANRSIDHRNSADCSDWVSFKDLIKVENKKEYPFPPTFRATPNSDETVDLVKRYSQTQNQLKDILKRKDFLQFVLEEYCQN